MYEIRLLDLRKNGILFLSQVLEIISRYKILYWIEYGTLLGAVRHNGLIPWDSEFDIGVFYNDWKTECEDELKEKFVVRKEIDRIKVYSNISIGQFNVDIHLHTHKGDHTMLRFGSFKYSGKSIIRQIHWYFKVLQARTNYQIRYSTIMRVLSNYVDIEDINVLSEVVTIIPGKYNHEKSFKVIISDLRIEDHFIIEIRKHRRLGLYILNILPKRVITIIEKKLRSHLGYQIFDHKYQVMPINVYDEFITIKFENIYINAPKNFVFFLNTVYGHDWHIPNIRFSRSNMRNLRNGYNE